MPLPIALDEIADFSTARVVLIKGRLFSSVPATEFAAADDVADFTTFGRSIISASDYAAFQSVAGTKAYYGSSTRDLTVAGGDQAITGVGFQPVAVFFWGAVQNSYRAAWGAAIAPAGVANQGSIRVLSGSGSAYQVNQQASMWFYTDASNNTYASVTAIGSDGFTLTWTKTGSPTGSAVFRYLAIG